MTEDAVTAIALTKIYPGAPTPAVDHMTFSVPAGQSVGLLGPNGAGKTTLLKLACGVSPPTAGQITVHGAAPGGTAKRDLAVVHQSGPFDMMLTVQDNLRIAAAFRGLSWRRVRSAPPRCWISSISPVEPATSCSRCPADSGAGFRWCARCCGCRGCCCWTNRPPVSTWRAGAESGT